MAAEDQSCESLKLGNQVCFPLYACSKELIRQYGPYLKESGKSGPFPPGSWRNACTWTTAP